MAGSECFRKEILFSDLMGTDTRDRTDVDKGTNDEEGGQM